MQRPSPEDIPPSGIGRIERQLEKFDDLTRNLATRQDLADVRQELAKLRNEVVQNAVLEPQLLMLKNQIQQVDTARIADKNTADREFEEIKKDQISRADRFWTRISPAIAIGGFLIALAEFLSHLHYFP